SRVIRGRQPTKEWLEDLIPTLTEYEIVGVNVYEILEGSQSSTIAAGKALYVVDIPDSERAPHQSKRDGRYYVRLGSKSQPASHRLIEDIRNRGRTPDLELEISIKQVFLSAREDIGNGLYSNAGEILGGGLVLLFKVANVGA